jgi:hypothetical protein
MKRKPAAAPAGSLQTYSEGIKNTGKTIISAKIRTYVSIGVYMLYDSGNLIESGRGKLL